MVFSRLLLVEFLLPSVEVLRVRISFCGFRFYFRLLRISASDSWISPNIRFYYQILQCLSAVTVLVVQSELTPCSYFSVGFSVRPFDGYPTLLSDRYPCPLFSANVPQPRAIGDHRLGTLRTLAFYFKFHVGTPPYLPVCDTPVVCMTTVSDISLANGELPQLSLRSIATAAASCFLPPFQCTEFCIIHLIKDILKRRSSPVRMFYILTLCLENL